MNGLVGSAPRTAVVVATFVTFLCLSSYGAVASVILVPAWYYFLSALKDWASRQERRAIVSPSERHAVALQLLRSAIIQPGFIKTRRYWRGRNGSDMNSLVYEPCVCCRVGWPKKMKHLVGAHIGEYNIHQECVPHFLAPFLCERFVLLRHLTDVPGDVVSFITAFLYRCCETPYATRHDVRPSIQMTEDVHRSARERKHAWQSYPRRERRLLSSPSYPVRGDARVHNKEETIAVY
jgi:hypothetical protein